MLLFDLAGADERLRWSPFCWRIKLALAHKRITCETVPWHYHQKELLGSSGDGAVPVLVDGDRYVTDSWHIAEYLEETYPHGERLFNEPAPHPGALFVKHWVEAEVHRPLRHLTMLDMLRKLEPRDQPYFRRTREQMFGQSLEDFCANRALHIERLRQSLEPARRLLQSQPYLSGAQPAFADHLLLGSLLWGLVACGEDFLAASDTVAQWRNKLLRQYEVVLP